MMYNTKHILTFLSLFTVALLHAQVTTENGKFKFNRLISLKEVTYVQNGGLTIVKDDDSHGGYAPVWNRDEPNKNNPISYYSGSKIKIKAKFDISCNGFNVDNIRLQPYFEATESTPYMKFPAQKPNAIPISTGKYELEYLATESTQAFIVNQICYVGSFGSKWRISYDKGTTYEDLPEKSSNELYVTWKKPVEENSNSSLSTYFQLHTLFHLTCKPLNGMIINDDNDLIGSVWKMLFEVDLVGQNSMLYRRKDNVPLKYYGTYNTTSLNCPNLIKTGDGQCNAFAQLLIQLLRVHGYNEASQIDVRPNKQSSPICEQSDVINDRTQLYFLVKKWYFFDTPARSSLPNCSEMPFHIITKDLGNANSIGEWNYLSGTNIPRHLTYGYVQDNFGVQGQNSANPQSWFNFHSIVKIGTMYYDPSYGVKYENANDMRDNYLDGWSIITKKLSEVALGYDVDGDGIINNKLFNVWSTTNKPNLFTINFEQ